MKKRFWPLILIGSSLLLSSCDFLDDNANWRCTPQEFFSDKGVSSPSVASFSTDYTIQVYGGYIHCPYDSGGYGLLSQWFAFSDPEQTVYSALKKCSFFSIGSWDDPTGGTHLALDYGVCAEDYCYQLDLRTDGQLLISYSNGDIFPTCGSHYYRISTSDVKTVMAAASLVSVGQAYVDAASFTAAKGTINRAKMFGNYRNGHNYKAAEEADLVKDLGPYDVKVVSEAYSGYYLYYDCGSFEKSQFKGELYLSFYLGDSNVALVKDMAFILGTGNDWHSPS